MTPDELVQVVNIIDKGDCTDELNVDESKATTSLELRDGHCSVSKSGEHRTFLGYTGDCWPAFCTECGMFARESDAFPEEDD